MKKSWIAFITVILSLGLVLGACGSSDGGSDSGSSDKSGGKDYKLVKDGKFTFAASGEFKPFSYMDGGKMVGYDIAVGKAIAKELGLEPNPVKTKFAGIVAGVKAGRYDAAVASHTITEDRLKQVDFSTPYYYSGPRIFSQPDSGIKTADDLKGKTIAVSRGSTYVSIAQEYTDDIQQYDSDVVALQGLSKGKCDVVITDSVTGLYAQKKGLKIQPGDQLDVSKQAVAVSKKNPELLKAVNKALKDLEDDGTLAKLSKKWIGKDITKEPETSK